MTFLQSRLVALTLVGTLLVGCAQGQSATEQTPQTDPLTEQPDFSAAEVERAIHRHVNRVRAESGLPQLVWNDTLATVGRRYSADMAERDFFAHVDPDGRTPSDRASALGFECRKVEADYVTTGVGENLFVTSLYGSYRVTTRGNTETRTYAWKELDELAREVVEGWMSSPGHRRNLLEAGYDGEGIGVVITDEDRVYVTQVLC